VDLLFFAVLCTGADMASYNITAGFRNFPDKSGFRGFWHQWNCGRQLRANNGGNSLKLRVRSILPAIAPVAASIKIKSDEWPLVDLLAFLSAGVLGLFVTTLSAGAAAGFIGSKKVRSRLSTYQDGGVEPGLEGQV